MQSIINQCRPHLLDALLYLAVAGVVLCGLALYMDEQPYRHVACSPERMPAFAKTAIRAR